MNFLKTYLDLRDDSRYTDLYFDLSMNPYFLGHVAELGWILNEIFLNRENDCGLYIPTAFWKRRGKVAVAVFMTYLNIEYNRADEFRHVEAMNRLYARTHLAVCSQFWLCREFEDVEVMQASDYADVLHPVAEAHYDDPTQLGAAIGLAARKCEECETDAMLRFSDSVRGFFEGY